MPRPVIDGSLENEELMKTVSYKLNQYKIVALDHGELYWETYASFARTMSGKCFIKGKILFMSPYDDISEPGFLIMEYNQFLEKLPRWAMTEYYCCNYTIKTSSDGKALTKDEMLKWSRDLTQHPGDEIKNNATECPEENPAIASYKLGRYEIAEHEKGGLVWKIHTGLDRLKTGECFIEGDVIFIGDGKTIAPGVLKSDDMKSLAELPQWTKTRYYCDRYTLKNCQTARPPFIKETLRTFDEVSLSQTDKAAGWMDGSGCEKQNRERKAQFGRFHLKNSGFLRAIREYKFPKDLGRIKRPHALRFFSAVSPRKHIKWFLGAGISLTAVSLLAGGAVFIFSVIEDDKHKSPVRHRKYYDRSHDDSQRGDRHAISGTVSPAESSRYKRNCGGCHFAYPPDLLPSRSWRNLIAGLGNHFGEVVALDPDSKKIVAEHLTLNAAEYSRAKHSKKIMESIGDQNPIRVTAISYIQHKHRKISALVFARKSIGSLSNCPSCHITAENGTYGDDEVIIPR